MVGLYYVKEKLCSIYLFHEYAMVVQNIVILLLIIYLSYHFLFQLTSFHHSFKPH